MGDAARRKGLVDDVRKKIGEQAAAAMVDVRQDLDQVRLVHQGFVYEMARMRLDVAAAKAAPAELRRDVHSFRGSLEMKGEQLEALGLRLQELTRGAAEGVRTFSSHDDRIAAVGRAIDMLEEQLYTTRYNAGADAQRVARFETMTFWQRLRWMVRGRLPVVIAAPAAFDDDRDATTFGEGFI